MPEQTNEKLVNSKIIGSIRIGIAGITGCATLATIVFVTLAFIAMIIVLIFAVWLLITDPLSISF